MTATGITDGQTATVTITATNVTVLTTSDGRCQQQGAGLVCTCLERGSHRRTHRAAAQRQGQRDRLGER